VVVALYFCFPYVREREALAPLWKYLTFTQNLELDISSQGTFSHAWSLCIEEQFYSFYTHPGCLGAFQNDRKGILGTGHFVFNRFAIRFIPTRPW
jgi:peptidoglycan/LPS O-acetylase OafA/YrhL